MLKATTILSSLVAVFSLSGCAAVASESDDRSTTDDSNEIKLSDIQIRGAINADRCIHTAGSRATRFIAFEFEAKAGQELVAKLAGYASPDLRILDARSKQLARGKKTFEGDGVDGGFVNTLTFTAPTAGKYFVAIGDTSTRAGEVLPEWVRPTLALDAVGTRAEPGACVAMN